MTNNEHQRLEAQRQGEENWLLWGPYLAERAWWGKVREDYSADGKAWEHFTHDQSCSRVYRWNEDGLGGICDNEQRLCFSLALWNGRDPILSDLGLMPGIGQALIDYVPGESNSFLFGGNSNWRGPIWFPSNYSLIETLEKFHRYLGDNFKVSAPGLAMHEMTLKGDKQSSFRAID